ncbi:MAG: hypothetical protein V1679_02470 [Candidatus Peregrinibacteria bacterium]
MKKRRRRFRDVVFSSFLDEGESIVHIAHRHVIVFKLNAAKTTFFGIILPLGGYLLFPQFYYVFILWGTIGFLGYLYHFIDWYYDAWLLTTAGVIDIERKGLFEITATRIEYHMIEGTAYTKKGFLQMALNFGDITIDKLGAQTSVCLKDASNPRKLEARVMKCQEKYVYDRSIRDHHALKGMLSDMIAYHLQNKKIKDPGKGQ